VVVVVSDCVRVAVFVGFPDGVAGGVELFDRLRLVIAAEVVVRIAT